MQLMKFVEGSTAGGHCDVDIAWSEASVCCTTARVRCQDQRLYVQRTSGKLASFSH